MLAAYVCVCLRVNHHDVIRLGVKVDQGLPGVRHYIPRLSGEPLERPLVVLLAAQHVTIFANIYLFKVNNINTR